MKDLLSLQSKISQLSKIVDALQATVDRQKKEIEQIEQLVNKND